MEDTDKVLLGVIALASVATAINTGITAGSSPDGSGPKGPRPGATPGDDPDNTETVAS